MGYIHELILLGGVAAVVVAIKEVAQAIRQRPHPVQVVTRRMPPAFVPMHCGRAVEFAGLTEVCGRRVNHNGRCMCEAEIQQVADLGAPLFQPVEIRPTTSVDDELRIAAAELGKHVADMPVSMPGSLEADQFAWLSALRVMVDSMNRGTDWGGVTREQDSTQFK